MDTKYKHLSCEERALIQLMLEQGCTLRAIARSVQRSPSTISREVARNASSHPARRADRNCLRSGAYTALAAQARADRRAATPRRLSRLAIDGPLWPHVEALLRRHRSPEQIASMLARMFPDLPALHVSHETIYTALYAMPRGELRSELIACLRQGRKRRRPRSRGADRRGTIPHMTSLHERPAQIDERLLPGHWEGDLIKGARNASAIGTLVERPTWFVALAKMAHASAEAAVQGFSTVLNRIDAQRRLSMTYDPGREMAQHEKLSERTGIKADFADPHRPGQRGINENTNGLLRQYFPKGKNLSVFSQDELDAVAWELNTRPRKGFGWRGPAELFLADFDYVQYCHQA